MLFNLMLTVNHVQKLTFLGDASATLQMPQVVVEVQGCRQPCKVRRIVQYTRTLTDREPKVSVRIDLSDREPHTRSVVKS